MNFYIVGAGGHSKVVLEIVEECGHPISFIDSFTNEIELFGYPILRTLPESFNKFEDRLLLALGNNATRKRVAQGFPYTFSIAVHKSANLSKRTVVGSGTVIMAGVNVNSGVSIGEHVILNTSCNVDHDCTIGDFVHVSPNAAVAGNVNIGEGTHVGIGASIIQGIKIGRWVTIGAGAAIIEDIPDYAVIVGVPGKIIKYNNENEF